MWKLSNRSYDELEHVHPHLVECVEYALEHSPVDFGVHDGLRTKAEQADMIASGASRIRNSRHLKGKQGYAQAVDLVPYLNGKLRWEWPLIYPLAKTMHQASLDLLIPLRWGGVWDRRMTNLDRDMEEEVQAYVARRKARFPKRKVFIDGPHFELPKTRHYL